MELFFFKVYGEHEQLSYYQSECLQKQSEWNRVFLLSTLCIISLDRNPDWDTIEAWNEFFALVYHFSLVRLLSRIPLHSGAVSLSIESHFQLGISYDFGLATGHYYFFNLFGIPYVRHYKLLITNHFWMLTILKDRIF